tara:strand:+ start:1505 stop:3802 length:2298 start_codon:yes stop_codon:yes gene_type:complete
MVYYSQQPNINTENGIQPSKHNNLFCHSVYIQTNIFTPMYRLIIVLTFWVGILSANAQNQNVKHVEDLPQITQCKSLSVDPNKNSPDQLNQYKKTLATLQHVEIQPCKKDLKVEYLIDAITQYPVNSLVLYLDKNQKIPQNLDSLKTLTTLTIICGDHPENLLLTELSIEFINLYQNERFIIVNYYSNDAPSDDFIFSFYDAYPNSLVEILAEDYVYPDPDLQAVYTPHPFVTPLLNDTIIKKQSFLLSTNKPQTLLLPSGSSINVPENAFVDENRTVVTTPVQIDYREFNDPIAMVLSGISMQVKSDNPDEILESAGMFEINFSSNGNEVYVANNKELTVNVASNQTENNYSQFVKSTETDSWTTIGDSNSLTASALSFNNPLLTQAYYYYRNYYLSAPLKPIVNVDTNTLSERFYSSLYIRDQLRTDYRHLTNLPERKQYLYAKKHIPRIKLSKVNRKEVPKELATEGIITLEFNSRKFPELTSFRRLQFITNDYTRKEVYKALIRKKAYLDARLEHISGNEFTLFLKDYKGELHEVNVEAMNSYFYDNERRNQRVVNQSYYSYNRKLQRASKKFLKKTEEALANNAKVARKNKEQLDKQELIAWNSARKMMNDREREMDFEEWNAYANNLDQFANQVQLSQSYVERSFRVQGAGIYNIDRISKEKNSMNIQILANNDPSLDLTVYYMPEKMSTCIKMYKGGYFVYKDKPFTMVLLNNQTGEIAFYKADSPSKILDIDVSFKPKAAYDSEEKFRQDCTLATTN